MQCLSQTLKRFYTRRARMALRPLEMSPLEQLAQGRASRNGRVSLAPLDWTGRDGRRAPAGTHSAGICLAKSRFVSTLPDPPGPVLAEHPPDA